MDTLRNVAIQFGDPLRFGRIGQGLSASRGSEGITFSASAAGNNRCAVSDVIRGSWAVELDVLSTPAGASAFYFGLCAAPERALHYHGRPSWEPRPHDLSVAKACSVYMDRNGRIWKGNAVVGNLPAPRQGDRVVLRYDDQNNAAIFGIGSNEASVSGIEGTFCLAVNIGATSARLRLRDDIDQIADYGQYRPAGVWGRMATMGHRDTQTGLIWHGRIAADGDPEYELRADFAVMGRTGRSIGAVGEITLINTPDEEGGKRALDDWLAWNTRGEPVTVYVQRSYSPASSGRAVARAIVDSIARPNENALAVICRDRSADLEIPWQQATYPDSAPNQALRGRRLPRAVGECRGAPLTCVDTANLHYDLSDDITNGAPSAVYDRLVPLSAGAGYAVEQGGRRLVRLTNPAGLQCADVAAGLLEGEAHIDGKIGDFLYFSGGAPEGWSNVSAGGGQINGLYPGLRLYRPASGGAAIVRAGTLLPNEAQWLRVDVNIRSLSGGPLRVQTGGSSFSDLAVVASAGMSSFIVQNPAGRQRLQLSLSAAGEAEILNLRVVKVDSIRTLSQHLRHALTYAGGLQDVTIDPAIDADASALMQRDLCLYAGPDDRRSVRDVIDELVNSAAGAWWFDALGAFRMARFIAPESMTPELALSDANIIGEVSCELDAAPGLSMRIACDPTWALHSASDVADSVMATPAGRARAERYGSAFGYVADHSGAQIAPEYRHARAAEPWPTLFSGSGAGSAAQWLRLFFVQAYKKPRRIYRLQAAFEADRVQPGQCVALDHGGSVRRLRVIGVRGRYASGIVNLTLWG